MKNSIGNILIMNTRMNDPNTMLVKKVNAPKGISLTPTKLFYIQMLNPLT